MKQPTYTNIDDLLDQYLDGLITQEQVRQLHQNMERRKSDDDADHVQDRSELNANILVELLRQQAATPNEPAVAAAQPTADNSLSSKFWQYLPLGSVFAITGVMIWVAYTMFYQSYLVLSDQYFTPYPINTLERPLLNTAQQATWLSAIQAYQRPNYMGAANQFKRLYHQQAPDDFIDAFYIGICYLAAHQPREAIVYLEQSSQRTHNEAWRNNAYWYLGLAYLYNENIQYARNYLEKVAASDSHLHKKDAATLLQEIQ